MQKLNKNLKVKDINFKTEMEKPIRLMIPQWET
jgi:hypothetical protein